MLPKTIFGLLILIGFNSWGQETIKGIVICQNEPVPGITVTESGTNDQNKVMTNEKGEFEIKTVRSNSTLTFSFVGLLTKTIKIRKQKTVKVKMKVDRPKYKDIALRTRWEATTANKS